MSREFPENPHDARGFPRVSGDEPTYGTGVGYTFEFSPRERG